MVSRTVTTASRIVAAASLVLACSDPAGTPEGPNPAADGGISPDGGAAASESPFGFDPARSSLANADPYLYAKDLGIRFERGWIMAYWDVLQPDLNSATYTFSTVAKGGLSLDGMVAQVPASVQTVGNLALGTYSTGSTKGGAAFTPVDASKYSAFVRAVVERYDGDGVEDMPGLASPIKYWQIENEPLPSSDDGYPALAALAYDAIKSADPTSTVLFGSVIAGVANDGGYMTSIFASTISAHLQPLTRRVFDVCDIHFYGNAIGDYRIVKTLSDSLRGSLDSHGFSGVPIWFCEMGTYSGAPAATKDTTKVWSTERRRSSPSCSRQAICSSGMSTPSRLG